MAWSSASVGATYRANAALDKPMLVGVHRQREKTSGTYAFRSGGSFASGSDVTDTTNGPSSYMADGFVDLRCKPSSSGTTHYYCLNFGTTVTIDVAAIINHNFGSIGGLTVTLEVADDNAFSTNPTTIATWSPGSSTKRLVELVLKHTGSTALQYTTQYARLKMTKGSSFTPQIGELILGVRRQLTRNPNREFDADHLRTYASEFIGATRKRTRYIHAVGQKLINARFEPDDATEQADIRAFWQTDIAMGRHPFLYIPQPTTAPQSAYLMHGPLDLQLPDFSPGQVRWDLVAEEQGDVFVSGEA